MNFYHKTNLIFSGLVLALSLNAASLNAASFDTASFDAETSTVIESAVTSTHRTNESEKPQYKLYWKDTFRGKHFNEDAWTKIKRGGADWNRHMSDHESLYEVKKGKLILYGRVNDGIAPSDTSRFITGGLYTKGKKAITYGKVEVKARLQGATGCWPAIWLLPETGKWPKAGEIDIMERLNHDDIAYQTVHSYYTYVLKEDQNPPHGGTGAINPDGYNVYAVEILPDRLVFSINGKHTFTYPKIDTDKEGQWPFGTPFYLLVDMQIEGSWVGKADPSQYPVKMEVDWVKMYELKNPQSVSDQSVSK